MNRARRKAVELRRKLGLRGRVDAEEVANLLGLVVQPWPLAVQEEMLMGRYIGVAQRLDPRWRRWVIAHAIGHKLLHPGNHLWVRDHTSLGGRYEREAEDFARALLVDGQEAMYGGGAERTVGGGGALRGPAGDGGASAAAGDGVIAVQDTGVAGG